MGEPNHDIARIRAYLEEHRAAYDQAVLRQQLLDDGHDPQAVDAAIAQVYGAPAAEPVQVEPLSAPSPPGGEPVPVVVPLPSDGDQETAITSDLPEGTAPPSGLPTLTPTPDVERIREYLERLRNTYTQSALRQGLLADGHDPEAVDLAMAQVFGLQVAGPEQPAQPPATGRIALIIIATFLFNYIALPVIAGGISSVAESVGGLDVFSITALLVFGVLVAEVVAYFVLRRRNRTLARGIGWGIVATLVPLAGLLLLFGVCLAIIGVNFS